MNQKRRDYWMRYIRDLADRMELRDWSVLVCADTAREGAGASVKCTFGRKIIEITLAHEFDEFDPEKQRHYLIHELVHVHFWGVTQALADVRENMNRHWIAQLELRVHNAEEYGVDGIATILAHCLPLPPKKNRKEAS